MSQTISEREHNFKIKPKLKKNNLIKSFEVAIKKELIEKYNID